MEIVLLWFGFALVVGVLAGKRGRSGIGWFLLACVISPLLAGLFVLALGNAKSPRESGRTRPCPFCAEPIQAAAVKCKHCGSDLNALPMPPD